MCKWFKDNLLSFAFGFNMSLGYMAMALNGLILPQIYNSQHLDTLGLALSIGLVLSFL